MKTTKTYELDIKQKYLSDETSSQLRGDLYNLTRSNIRNVCLSLIDECASVEDSIVMKNYFKLRRNEDLRRKVENYDIEGFRPICNFLRGDTSSIQSTNALELIAVMIDFRPRPYNKYRNENLKNDKQRDIESEDIKVSGVTYVAELNKRGPEILVKPRHEKLFVWFSNASAFNKLLFFGGGLLLFVSVILTTDHVLNNKMKWMVWQGDHYVKVKFDDEKYNINHLKAYREDRIKYFKKVIPTCETVFFDTDKSVKIWYGKNSKKELEYFTDFGLHPETKSTLKPITNYMIKKHICVSFNL